jgi:FkbM family methyltransferase
VIKKFIKNFLKSAPYATKSYSQEGEDLVVNKLLQGKRDGFYVEVGAHHPYRFSNTYFFYKRGWCGICIDPLPGLKKLFLRARPNDIAREKGVSLEPGKLTFFMFNDPALNTFDIDIAKERDGKNGYKIINHMDIETISLRTILDGYEIANQIDFFSIDVEGLDLQVLHSNDWGKYRPTLIIVESLSNQLSEIRNDPICQYLISVGYSPIAKTGLSVIYKENRHE